MALECKENEDSKGDFEWRSIDGDEDSTRSGSIDEEFEEEKDPNEKLFDALASIPESNKSLDEKFEDLDPEKDYLSEDFLMNSFSKAAETKAFVHTMEWKKGDRCEAKYSKDQYWYSAKIAKVMEGNKFEVVYCF